MKLAFTTAFLLCAAAGMANAETFTFKSTSHTLNSISIATGTGTNIGAGFNEGESQVVYSSGQKATSKTKCAGWSAPVGSQFTDEGVCTLTEGANEQSSIAFSCIADMKAGAADCWGALRGTAGRNKGKTGTISWHQTNNPDGNVGAAAGTGMWND
jgi:hypothetical protein